MDETEAYTALCDARASMGWPDDWEAERHPGGWAFRSAAANRTYVVSDTGGVDRTMPGEIAAQALERMREGQQGLPPLDR